ncbi:MAG: hypothetical protein QOE70_1814 [Chthoniobacter sp.]|jgi:hypothetical protein|nr:hypothetical protein [Chthoniobacter sp.]
MKTTAIRLLLLAILVSFNQTSWARAVYALTPTNELLVVNSDVPQEILSIATVTGLNQGEQLLGIDVRPSNGQLYALSNGPRLFIINPSTAVATLVAALTADPADASAPFTALVGTRFSIDFNPVVDRLRVVSDADQNLRINPADGLVTTDTALAYDTDTDGAGPDTGDINAGVNPNIGGIAYTNNVAGALATKLYGIDDQAIQIVEQTPPNNGTLNSIAPFGIAGKATHVGFDIAPDGIAYAAGVHLGTEYVLVTVDPTTGVGESHGPIGDGTIPIRDIAVATTVAFSAPHYAVSESGPTATITVTRDGFLNSTVSVQYRTSNGSASAASDYSTTTGAFTFGPGQATMSFQVPIKNDTFPEADEFVNLSLINVTGPAVIGPPSTATLRINANDRDDVVGPQVEFVGLTGPSRGISGAVVFFNEDMDPASVVNLSNYKLFGITVGKGGVQKLQTKTFNSAVYDAVERSVRLSLTPFQQTNFQQMALRIRGQKGGVTDLAGNRLDGNRDGRPGGDLMQFFKVFSGTTVKFTDRDGDRVKLTLTGGGRLDGVVPLGGPGTQKTQFWILDPIALQTSLGGSVQKSTRGDGIVVIAEIIGLDKKEFSPISTNPAFQVNRLTFSSNATGLR